MEEGLTLSKIVMLVEDVVNVFITIAEIGAIAMIVYSGFTMATAGDDPAKFKKGKTMLINSCIGLLVIFGVGIIINTIADAALDPTNILR